MTMLFGVLLSFAAVLQSQAILYPYGSGTSLTSGDDVNSVVSCPMGTNFPFYGTVYDKVWASTNGFVSMVNPTSCGCWTGIHTAAGGGLSGKPYVSHFWCDHNVNVGGTIYFEKIELGDDTTVDSYATADASLIGLSLVPNVTFIGTWIDVGGFGKPASERNTHQIVITSDGTQTVCIFNYECIDWFQTANGAAIQFSKGDGTWAPLSISGTAESAKATDYSNVGIPGKIVTRCDSSTITAPTLTKSASCTVNLASGLVDTFDGADLNINLASRKFLISKSSQSVYGNSEECKFMMRMTTDANGVPDWMGFSIAIHPGSSNKYLRNLQYDFVSDVWKSRGWQGSGVFTPSWSEHITKNGQDVTIHVDPVGSGYVIWTDDCDYRVHVNICGTVKLFLLSDEYAGSLIGMCQDNDGDGTVADESEECSVCPTCGTPSGVALTCSCPLQNGSTCNNYIKKNL